MEVKVTIVDAFVDEKFGGNPAGVVLDADSLSAEQKLLVAKQVGLSETAFVSESNSGADFKLDFFTPEKQIAHCGHATVATFSYLAKQGLIPNPNTSKQTIDGNREIRMEGEFAYMEQLQPHYLRLEADMDKVLEALDLVQENTLGTPIIASTGNAFILVGVKDIHTLESLKPKMDLIDELSEQYDLIGFYVFTLETNRAGRDASARMFAPRYGIKEESATGMAAGPLACYLYDYVGVKKHEIHIEQGYAMTTPSPSCIKVLLTLKSSEITSLLAGGVGVVSSSKSVVVV
ncbi:PhzF family phenazine biosynthesis protein [Vibrio bivalvicida]|uniref:PhzF family phenazine biosynthesis protein n=1 Tax=Vibrio bivalvicida TaxID=1276888 RepID=A0ABV4MP24_9VIBR